MESSIKGIYFSKRGFIPLDFFAYTSKGLPGIEIIGLGNKSRPIKEKLIYLSRIRNIKIPLKKIVLCVESEDRLIGLPKEESMMGLEFPLLLLFWFLIGQIPIKNFDDCLASGNVTINGWITLINIPYDILLTILENRTDLKYISLEDNLNYQDILHIPAQELLESIKDLTFKSVDLSSSSE